MLCWLSEKRIITDSRVVSAIVDVRNGYLKRFSPVVSQMVLSPERLVANVTRVRTFVRVSALVYEQVVRLGEVPVTKPAYELFFGPRHVDVLVLPDGFVNAGRRRRR